MTVTEMFFSVEVRDMERAVAFYVDAFGATVTFSSPSWTSLHIAGVRLGLALNPEEATRKVGLHFAVTDLAAARIAVDRAGGNALAEAIEVAPGTVIADVTDTEGNTFALSQA